MRVINSTFRGIFDRPEKFLQRVDSEKYSTDRSQNHNTNFLRRAFSRKLRCILCVYRVCVRFSLLRTRTADLVVLTTFTTRRIRSLIRDSSCRFLFNSFGLDLPRAKEQKHVLRDPIQILSRSLLLPKHSLIYL